MLESGPRALPSENPVQPTSLIARTTNSTGHAYRVKYVVGSQNSGDDNTSRITGFIAPRFCRYANAMRLTKFASTGPDSETKNRYSFVARYRAVFGLAASPA